MLDDKNLINEVISNRYKITKFLGRGGMASVYLAKDTFLDDSEVALKILHETLNNTSLQYQRFVREVQLTRLVTHPNVVRTYDIGTHEGLTYFTMEVVEGVSLESILKEKQRLSIGETLYYVFQVCQGLSAIHKCDIVHRDLKPANIMVLKNNLVKITDFGVARPKDSYLTAEDNFCGTLPYVAPEVFTGDDITSATDCYSLGIMLFLMLTGTMPFELDIPAKIIARHLQTPPPVPSSINNEIPEWIDKLVLAMLAKAPQNRPPIDKIAQQIYHYLQDNPLVLNKNITNIISSNLDSTQTGETKINIINNLDGTVNETKLNKTVLNVSASQKTTKFTWKRLIAPTFITFLITLITFSLYQTDTIKQFEYGILDILFPLRGKTIPSDDVVIVAMNEQSYNNLSIPLTSPWPRSIHAKLLKKLAEYDVKRVVFDILFLDKGVDPKADQEFADAISNIPTVLGSSYLQLTPSSTTGTFALETYQEPYDMFLNQAASVGLVNLPADYGRIRRFSTERSSNYKRIFSLASAGAGAYLKKMELPKEYDLINYYGPAKTMNVIPYETVLEDDYQLPENLLKNKIVVVGLVLQSSSGPNQKEEFESPFHGSYIFGSEIHAMAISNIISKNWIKRFSPAKETLLSTALAFFMTICIFLIKIKNKVILGGSFAFIRGIISYIFFRNNIFLPCGSLFLLIIPCFTIVLFFYDFLTKLNREN